MNRKALLALLCALASSVGLAQSVTLHTKYGPTAANADRVMVSGEDGRWHEVTGEAGTYTLQLDSLRYSLAVTCFGPPGPGQGPHVTIYRFMADEMPVLRHACPGQGDVLTPPTQLRGTVTGVQDGPGLHHVTVQLGPRQLFARVVLEGTEFGARFATPAAADLLALYGPLGQAPTLALLHREADWSGGLPPLDFTADGALQLQEHTLTVDQAPFTTLAARLITCNGTSVDVAAAVPAGTEESSYAALPQGARAECDRYELTAFALEPGGLGMRLASTTLAEPASVRLQLPPPVGQPVIETVGTDPLRARFSWEAQPGVSLYLGGLTDGRVTWNFVQSARLAPSVTLPPWGADLGAPDFFGGAYSWTFGAVRSEGQIQQLLHAYGQHSVVGRDQFWAPTTAGLSYQVQLTGGTWAPHSSGSAGGP